MLLALKSLTSRKHAQDEMTLDENNEGFDVATETHFLF